MFERLTDRGRKVMALANKEAQRLNHEYIGTEHILLGLVKERLSSDRGLGVAVIESFDIDLRKVRIEVERIVKSGPDMVTMGKLPHTPRAKKVIEYAMEEAQAMSENFVDTGHLVLGLLREHDGVAAQVLFDLGVRLEEAREFVIEAHKAKPGLDVGDFTPSSSNTNQISQASGLVTLTLHDGEQLRVSQEFVQSVRLGCQLDRFNEVTIFMDLAIRLSQKFEAMPPPG